MALIDNVRALVAAGATEPEIKQALRAVMDEKMVTDHDAGLPNMPTMGPVAWAAFKAKLQSPGGPNNLHQMLKMGHEAMDADDQPNTWRAIYGVWKAAWNQHPGLRQDLRNRRPA